MIDIAEDSALPGFRGSFDMAQLRDDLEEAMPQLADVKTCRIDRFRYRRCERAVFLYEVETRNGREWITGSLWPKQKGWKEFQSNKALGFAPRTGMLLGRFPFDRKLLGIANVLQGNSLELSGLIHRLHGNDAKVTAVCLKRYRPGISATMKIDVSWAEGKASHYLKFYAGQNVHCIAEDHAAVKDCETISVLRPAGVLPSINAILWPEIQGTPLDRAIASGAFEVEVQVAADGLRSFHESSQSPTKTSNVNATQRDALRHADFVSTFLPGQAGPLISLAGRISSALQGGQLLPIHHDMKPEHMLVRDGRCHMIDVEGITLGLPEIDIGNMIARIEALSWLAGIDPAVCSKAAEQFAESSLNVGPDTLAAATALSNLKLATYAISHQIDSWAAIAHDLVSRALSITNPQKETSE